MSQSGTIVRRQANTFISEDYLKLVVAANPNGWSAAFIEEETVKVASSLEGATIEDVKETMEAYPDKDITFYFACADGTINQDDLSPYTLLQNSPTDPLVVAFVDGNFPNFTRPESSHPPEFFFVHEYLKPKFEGMAEMADSLNKITEAIKKPYFKKELLLNCVSQGYVTLVCANGAQLTFAQGDLAAEYPWGWVSNNHGYANGAPKKEEPVAEKKKGGLFAREASASTVREKYVPPKEAIAEAVKPTTTAGTVIKNWTTVKWKPKPTDSRSNKKDAYKSRIGYLPQGWEQCVEVNCYVDPAGKLSTFAQMNKALGLAAQDLITKTKNPPKQQGKDTDADNIEHDQTLPTASKGVTHEILPIMSPPGREYIENVRKTEKYKKMIAENAVVINDPKQFESYEKKFVDFAQQMGCKSMDEFAMWDFEMKFNLCNDRPNEAAVMLNTFANIYLRSRAKGAAEEVINTEVANDLPKKKGGLFARTG